MNSLVLLLGISWSAMGQAAASGPGPKPGSSPAPKGAMNVLFVIFDDLRVTHKVWGFDQSVTPNTDALAKKSLIFDNAYCNQAVCGPSRASLLSGRRPDTTQMWNFVGSFRDTPGAKSWNTWPEWFKKNGYFSAGTGKLFHPGDPENFDPPSWSDGEYGGYYGQDKCPYAQKTSHGCPIPNTTSDHKYPDIEALDTAKVFLDRAANDTSKPFWLGVGFVKPHMPHVFPARFLDMIAPKEDIKVAKNQLPPEGIAAQLDWETDAEGPVPNGNVTIPVSLDTQRDWKQNYYAAAAFSDWVLGELLSYLDDKGFSDNTLIVMTADHGWGLGEHNHWVKYTNWETDARVPLLVHNPKAPHTWNVHTKSLVEHVDLYPTLAELAGVPVTAAANESIEGTSYASLFADGSDPKNKVWTNKFNASFTQYPRCGVEVGPDGKPVFKKPKRCASIPKQKFVYMGYSMRTERWRYTEWALWDGTALKPKWDNTTGVPMLSELYDHEGDSLDAGAVGQKTWDDFENKNVAQKNPDIVAKLSARLRAFYDKTAEERGKAYGA